MASTVKQTDFEEYRDTLITIFKNIDEEFQSVLNRNHNKKKKVWQGFSNYKSFLNEIKKKAFKKSIEELGIAESTLKDRWNVLTLPEPIYCAIENGDISFSKAKLLTSIHFDFESDHDIEVAKELLEVIKSGKTNAEIKEIVKERSKDVWNESNVTIKRIAEQNGIDDKTMC